VVVLSNPVTVTVAGIGHALPPELLRRDVQVIEDIAHELERHNTPEGIAKTVHHLERIRDILLRQASE
jgi:hypothetical protein